MPMQLEPSKFTEEECQAILDVVGRDFRLRNKDKIRIQALEKEIEHIRTRRNLLTCNSNFNNTCCLNCFSTFIPIFIPRIRCPICGFNFCRKCFGEKESNETLLICPSCSKERDFLRKKNSWFYDEVETKFEKHCIAEIIKILQDINLFRTKAEKDGFNGDSQQSLTGSSLNDNDDVHTSYKQLMDMTLDKLKQAFDGNSVNFGNTDITKNKEILVVQRSVISLLLFSLLQELKGKSENMNHHNVDIERTIEESDVRVIEDFLTYALNEDKIHISHFNINPTGMRTYDYLEQLSEAIINKTINDVSHEGNKSIRNSRPNKVTLAVLAKMSEEKNEIFPGDNNNNDSSQDARRQSQRSLMDEDEISPFLNDDDLESLRSFTESKSKEILLPPVELPLEYTKKLYGFEAEEKIIGGRPLSFADPDLDIISMTSSPNVDNNFISPNIKSPQMSEGSWKIGERGSLIMRKRIPYGVNDHYGTERKNDEADDAIDGDDVKKLDEVSDDQNLVMFLPDAGKKIFPTDETKLLQTKSDKGRLESLNKGSIDDPDILENTNLTMFRRKKSLDNERLNVLSYTDDGNESSEAPRFVREPEDSTATLGKPLSLDCVVVGTKPIDITWYKHSKDLIELNGLGDRYITWQRGDNHKLEITSVTKEDHGYYMCMASNKAGFCQKGFRITVERKDDTGATQVQQQKANVTRNSLNFQADHGLTEQDTTKGLHQPCTKLTTRYNDDDDDIISSSEKETFTPSTSRESSFSNKHKKSSLTRRWLLGGVDNSDVKTKMDGENDRKPFVANNEEKIKSLVHLDEPQKLANKETKGEKSAVEREETRESSNKKVLLSNSNNIQPKSNSTSQSSKLQYCTDDETSGQGSLGDSLTSERPSFSEIPDSRNVTLQDAAERSGKAPLSPNVDILQLHNNNLEHLRENNLQRRYKIRSMSKSENNQRTSSGEDVFSSEAGESSDLGEELKTMPSVKELRKKFATDIVKDSRIRHIFSKTNQKNIEQRIQKVPVTDFQERSYVPLSPVPINRDQKSLDFNLGKIHHSEERGGLIRDDSSKIRQVSGVKGEFTDASAGHRSGIFIGNTMSEGFRVENERIARYDSNINHYQTNQLEANSRLNNHPSHRYGYAIGPEIIRSSQSLSQSPMYNKPEDRSTIGQKHKEGRSISASRLPSGSFVSKVVIGSDCDIVSSCSDLGTI